jgi:hypothetical protein
MVCIELRSPTGEDEDTTRVLFVHRPQCDEHHYTITYNSSHNKPRTDSDVTKDEAAVPCLSPKTHLHCLAKKRNVTGVRSGVRICVRCACESMVS